MITLFDVTQIKSCLNNRNLKEDVEQADELLNEAIYVSEVADEEGVEEVPNYLDEIERLKNIGHEHKNMAILNKITNEMVDSWNAKSIQITNVSQLENDSNYVSKEYLDEKIGKHAARNIILVSPNGSNFLLSVNKDGVLSTVKLEVEEEIVEE